MRSEPDWLTEMRDALPEEKVRRFLSRAAGMRLYVPGSRVASSMLVNRAGREIALWLSTEYGGEYIDVPSTWKPEWDEGGTTREKLRAVLREQPDIQTNTLAFRFGVSARRIHQLRADIEENPEPPLLRIMRSPSSD